MGRVVWKEGHFISIETREEIYVLARMLKFPFLVFFNSFSESNKWSQSSLENIQILFFQAVTRQFLKNSNITKQNIVDLEERVIPSRWIKISPSAREIIVWDGTEHERKILIIGDGGSLIEKEKDSKKFGYEKIIIRNIDFSDSDTINNYELMTISLFPELNERLYLCYKLGRNVDPCKDLIFNKVIPVEYKNYIEIISS